jgi:uncharacterized membrane protein
VSELGRLDSNQGSRDQNPLPYHLATPHRARLRGGASIPAAAGYDRGMSAVLLLAAAFAASAVEAVEALTIVLAVGVTRGWRSPLAGVAAALALLAAIVAALGPALTRLPISTLRVAVGGLLLVFGLQWLRKAILRAAGLKALHDEDAIFREQAEEARLAGAGTEGPDWYAFTIAFKGVLLEGLEVAFIVVTFGSNQGSIPLAAAGAAAAVVLVCAGGLAARAPLARVPENTLKFGVGLLLVSFGTFWGAEGAGADWPGSDLSIPALIVFYLAVSRLLVLALERSARRGPAALPEAAE